MFRTLEDTYFGASGAVASAFIVFISESIKDEWGLGQIEIYSSLV